MSNETMRALVWTGVGRMEWQRRSAPRPSAQEILVATKTVGVCGTDRVVFHGQFAQARPPLVMGHEGAGVVAEVGSGVTAYKPGDRVVISPVISCGLCAYCSNGQQHLCQNREVIGLTTKDGAFAEYFLAPASNAFRLPDSITWDEAAAVDALASTIHALSLVPDSRGEAVAIYGAGAAGLCFLQLCRRNGASRVIMFDSWPERLAKAASLGADHADDPYKANPVAVVKGLTQGLGAHVSIEASGSARAVNDCIHGTRNKGKILIYGVYTAPVDGVDLQDQHQREITIYGSSGAPDSYQTAIDLIGDRAVNVDALISHRITLDQLPHFFEEDILHKSSGDYLKAIVRMT